MTPITQETIRLQQAQERTAHWRRWGPYLSERQWGTVREDYSPYGAVGDFFPRSESLVDGDGQRLAGGGSFTGAPGLISGGVGSSLV